MCHLNLLPLWSSNFPSNLMAFMFFACNEKKAILSRNVSFNLQCISHNFINLPFSVVETEITQLHTCWYHKNYQQLPVDNFKGTHTHNTTCSYSLVLDRKHSIFNYWSIWSNHSLKKLLSWFIQINGWKDNLKLVKEILFCLPSLSRVRGFSLFQVIFPFPCRFWPCC